jgi:hypothetical protein
VNTFLLAREMYDAKEKMTRAITLEDKTSVGDL